MLANTRVAQRLGITYALIQGPFGNGASSPRLTATVSNAGGLGSYGAVHLGAEDIRREVAAIRALTSRPFAINLWIPMPGQEAERISRERFARAVAMLTPFYERLNVPLPEYREVPEVPRFADQVECLFELRPPAFSFVYGVPSADVLERCRRLGIVTIGAATNVDEAVALDAAGVDLIVATGAEAGGHRVSFLRDPDESPGVLALIPQVVDSVRTPIIAAGGIADGRGVAAAMALGAEGVQVGSAFLACEESNANPVHRAELRKPTVRYTTLTRAFSGRYARGVKNQLVRALKPLELDALPFPAHAMLTAPLFEAAVAANDADSLSLWAGQSASLIRHARAADLFEFLLRDSQRVAEKLSPRA